MAVTGLLVMALEGRGDEARRSLEALPGVGLAGPERGDQLAVVLEAPARELEGRLEEIQAQPGVLSAFVTYVNVEDELAGGAPPDGGHAR